LGHQIMALASGASTEKMKFGHHGANHPVQKLADGAVMVTSQNHGFTVSEQGLPETLSVTHRSLFDGSIQGIARNDVPAYSFQGHPEASPGPRDAGQLFAPFIRAMKDRRAEQEGG
jgi:carbamoyl-phosphate synthase small subunit